MLRASARTLPDTPPKAHIMPDDYEHILHRTLLRDARRLGNGTLTDATECREIVQGLMAILHWPDETTDYYPLRQKVLALLPSLADTDAGREIAAALETAFWESDLGHAAGTDRSVGTAGSNPAGNSRCPVRSKARHRGRRAGDCCRSIGIYLSAYAAGRDRAACRSQGQFGVCTRLCGAGIGRAGRSDAGNRCRTSRGDAGHR